MPVRVEEISRYLSDDGFAVLTGRLSDLISRLGRPLKQPKDSCYILYSQIPFWLRKSYIMITSYDQKLSESSSTPGPSICDTKDRS